MFSFIGQQKRQFQYNKGMICNIFGWPLCKLFFRPQLCFTAKQRFITQALTRVADLNQEKIVRVGPVFHSLDPNLTQILMIRLKTSRLVTSRLVTSRLVDRNVCLIFRPDTYMTLLYVQEVVTRFIYQEYYIKWVTTFAKRYINFFFFILFYILFSFIICILFYTFSI